MNIPTLDEAVERVVEFASGRLRSLFVDWKQGHVDPDVAARRLIRFVLDESGWEDLTAEVERLRENDRRAADEVGAHRSLTAQLQTHWQELEDQRDSLRDLCDKLAATLELVAEDDKYCGWCRYDPRIDGHKPDCIVAAALSLYQERK